MNKLLDSEIKLVFGGGICCCKPKPEFLRGAAPSHVIPIFPADNSDECHVTCCSCGGGAEWGYVEHGFYPICDNSMARENNYEAC